MTRRRHVPHRRPHFLRRRLIVHPQFQRRFMLSFTLAVLAGVGLALFVLAGIYAFQYTRADLSLKFFYLTGEPGAGLRETTLMRLVAPSLVIAAALSAVFTWVFGLFYSHRIAGPLFNLRRVIRGVRRGALPHRVRFRQGDEFEELAREMTKTVRWLRANARPSGGWKVAGRRPSRPGVVVLVLALAGGAGFPRPAAAVFDKGGLIDASPRSAALAGSDFAADEGLSSGCTAALSELRGPDALGSFGVATRAGLNAVLLRTGALVEGLGVGASFRNLAAGDTAERMWSAGLGMPVEEVPGLSFGAALKVMEADLYGDYGTGFGLDLSVRAALPVRVEWLEVDAAAGVEDAFGSVNWASGLREDIARQWRMGLAARIDGSLALLAEGRLVRGPSASEGIWAFGLEHALLVRGRACAIRIGWRDGTQRTGTLSAGLGVPLGQGMLEYAIAGAAQSQGYLHMVSARWQLGRAGADAGAGREPASSPSAPASSREGEVTPESDTLVAPSPYRVFSFPVRAPRAGRVEAWSVVILDAAGGVVWSVEGDGAPPSAVQWNGSTQRGELAPAGRYRCSLVLRGPGTFRSVSPGTGFRLVRPPEPARGAEPEGAGGY